MERESVASIGGDMKTPNILLSVLSCLALVACGGGGDEDSVALGLGAPVTQTGAAPAQGLNQSFALNARFNRPSAIATDSNGNLYVTDISTVRKISLIGEVSTVAGISGTSGVAPVGGADGTGSNARFNLLSGIAVDNDGNLFVIDSIGNSGRIRRITRAGIVSTVATDVYGPGIAADRDGNIFFADNVKATIGRLQASGTTSVVTGLAAPRGIAIDDAGNLFVMNTGLDFGPATQNTFSCTIEKVTPAGRIITVAGGVASRELENTCGSNDGADTIARIGMHAQGIAVGANGILYFTDTANHTIRRVTPAGTVSTLAGLPGSPGAADGKGAGARFNGPLGIAFGRDGNLYVADTGNHIIRRVSIDGTVITIGGKAGESGGADTNTAPLNTTPQIDPAGMRQDTMLLR
jgi:sugar lactone lactonase YvrE